MILFSENFSNISGIARESVYADGGRTTLIRDTQGRVSRVEEGRPSTERTKIAFSDFRHYLSYKGPDYFQNPLRRADNRHTRKRNARLKGQG